MPLCRLLFSKKFSHRWQNVASPLPIFLIELSFCPKNENEWKKLGWKSALYARLYLADNQRL
jgi:hypothetical protein